MPPGCSLYDVLGVECAASQDGIRAAYYAAIKQCHPDIASGPHAHDATILLIEAYAVLGNPDRRRHYDAEFLHREESPVDDSPIVANAPVVESSPVVNDARRAADDSVRDAPFVEPAVHSAAEPALQPEPENAGLHPSYIADEPVFDEPPMAYTVAGEALSLTASAANTRRSLRWALWSMLTSPARFSGPVVGAAAATLVLAILAGMMTVIFITDRPSLHAPAPSVPSAAVADAQRRTTEAAAPILTVADARRRSVEPSAPAVVVAAAQQRSIEPPKRSPCLDEHGTVKAETLYEQCVQARLKLHRLMMHAAGSAQLDEYKLQDAIAEMRQARGAGELRMSSTPDFVHESVASFADIRKSAKTDRVRRLADIYYNCYALKHCAR